jgi:hypothetical protein
MDRQDVFKGWLLKSQAVRGARACDHATKAIGFLLRQHRLGRFADEAKITLTLLTNILNDAGFRSPHGHSLKATMVARMFIHLDRTWQGFAVMVLEASAKRAIQTYDRAVYVESEASVRRRKLNQVKIDRALEKRRADAMEYSHALTNGAGKRLTVKEYFRRLRRKEKVKSYALPMHNIEADLRARMSSIDSSFGEISDAETAMAIKKWKLASMEALVSILQAELTVIRAKVAQKREREKWKATV